MIRPYQQEALASIKRRYDAGVHRQLAICPCGAGKTKISSELPRLIGTASRKARMLFIVDNNELTDQAVNVFERAGHSVSVEKAGQNANDRSDVVVATIQSLNSRDRMNKFTPESFGVVAVDECFPADHLVDGRKISDLAPFDEVSSWNHRSGSVERRQVRAVSKRPAPRVLLRITFSDGRDIVCTQEHPFFVPTAGEYIPASVLINGDYVCTLSYANEIMDLPSLREGLHKAENILLQGAQGRIKEEPEQVRSDAVLGLRSKGDVQGADAEVRQERSGLLLAGLFDGRQAKADGRASHNREAKEGFFRTHEEAKSNVYARSSSQDDKNFAAHQAQAVDTGREWAWGNGATITSGLDAWMENGVLCSDPQEAWFGISIWLQDRHREQGFDDRNRSGWRFTSIPREKISGSEKRYTSGLIRVDNIEVLEPGSDGTFGGLCPDGHVYNIEVEGNNNYFCNGILVHNCHCIVSNNYRKFLNHMRCGKDEIGDRLLIGVTATPDRPDGKSLREFFDAIVFEKTLAELQQDGLRRPDGTLLPYLVELRGYRISTQCDVRNARVRAGDFVAEDVSAAVDTPARNRLVAEKYLEHGQGMPAMGFCASIKHAQNMAEVFNSYGIRAAMVTGDTKLVSRNERRKIIEQCRTGEIRAVFSALALGKGTDIPIASVALHLTPTLSSLKYRQETGRVSRPYPAPEERILKPDSAFPWLKPYAIVLDFVDNTRHPIQTVSSMFDLPVGFNCRGRSVSECAKKFKDKQASLPLSDLSTVADLDQLESASESINLFASREPTPELRRITTNMWTRDSAAHAYRLVMKNMIWEVHEDKLGDWKLYERRGGNITVKWTERSLKEIIHAADCLICGRGEDFQIIDGNQSWRRHPPGDKQAYRVWNEVPELHKDFRTPEAFFNYARVQYFSGNQNFSKGGLSSMIDRLKLRKEQETTV